MKRIPLTLAALFAVVLITGCSAGEPQNQVAQEDATLALWPMSTTSDEARQQMTDGVHEFDMGRLESAYQHFDRAIAADPNLTMAELWAAYAAPNGASIDAQFAHMARAVALSQKGSEVEKLIVSTSNKSLNGDDEGALADAQQLVKLDPNGARSWDLLGFMYDAVRDRANARTARDKAIEIAPGLVVEYMNQSVSYAQNEPRDLPKAEQLARKAVELAPNDQGPYDILGDALRAQGKLEEAGQAYTKCAELDPTRADCLQQRGHVQTFLGKWAEARADYDAATAIATGNAKAGLAMYRSFVSLHEGNPKAAVAELEQLYASVDGMNVPDPVGTKQFLLSQAIIPITIYHGMIPEAQSAIERQTQLYEQLMQKIKTPDFQRNTRAQIALDAGYLALTKGDYAGATAKAQEYMKIRESDRAPAKNVPAHVLLGYVAYNQKRYADAVAEFEQGNPDNILVNYRQAQSLEALGRNAEAQKLYDKIANYYFNSVQLALVRREALAKVKTPAA